MNMLRRRPALEGAPASPESDREPLDDAEDFDITDGQMLARDLAHTKKQMLKVWNEIWGPNGSLSAYAKTLRYVKVKRER